MNPSKSRNYDVRRKYSHKKSNAKKEGIEFKLSLAEYVFLIKKARITHLDVGPRGYHLARHGDAGNYEIGNCEFVWYLTNLKDRQVSDRWREASRRNMALVNSSSAASAKRLDSLRKSPKLALYYSRLRQNSVVNRMRASKLGHPSYSGNRNSQFGSFWITNGIQSRKGKISLGNPPIGFRKGRVV
ncbi:hypothetical protein M0R72_09355 [Candidatus Pacearchaeota archaeon]|nr:hypothetical protein [Candidatus Pacearchaeota archaeon]